MRFLVRQKVFSFGDDFTIKDEYGQDWFQVRGKVFSLGDKLRIYDMDDREILYIEQKLFRFLPEYYIYYHGQAVTRVKKQFSFFTPRFNVESPLGLFSIQGNFLGMDFSIFKDGNLSAHVSKKWFSFSDTYGVEIQDDQDYAFTLALVIVIDQVLHDNKNQ